MNYEGDEKLRTYWKSGTVEPQVRRAYNLKSYAATHGLLPTEPPPGETEKRGRGSLHRCHTRGSPVGGACHSQIATATDAQHRHETYCKKRVSAKCQ